jgi:hypothetical protein
MHHYHEFAHFHGHYVGGDPSLVWPLLLIIAVVAVVAATDRRKRK